MFALPTSKLTAVPVPAASRPAHDCFHCGLPLPAHADSTAIVDGEPRAMCCQGCAAVAQAIVDMGLGQYYRLRAARPAAAAHQHHSDIVRDRPGGTSD